MPTEVQHETNRTRGVDDLSERKISPIKRGPVSTEPVPDALSYISSSYYLQLLAEKEREIRNLQL
jgi:hypothetical protein